jgi:hypothetical protein
MVADHGILPSNVDDFLAADEPQRLANAQTDFSDQFAEAVVRAWRDDPSSFFECVWYGLVDALTNLPFELLRH